MSDWVELLERQEREQRREKVRVVADQPVLEVRKTKRSLVVDMSLVIVIVLVVGGSLWGLSSLDTGEPESNVNAQQATPAAQPTINDSEKMLVVGSADCRVQPGQIGDESGSLRAAVAEFERAYFAHDVDKLIAVLSKDSALRAQDWAKVLSNEVPKETSWCAKISPVTGETAEMDLQMNIPGRDETTFQQTVTGEKTKAGWRIVAFEPRKGK